MRIGRARVCANAKEVDSGPALRLIRSDLDAFRPRLRLVEQLVAPLPTEMFNWLRPYVYRLAGIRIGPRGRILGPLTLTGRGDIASRVCIGSDCFLTTPLFLNASGPITIGDRVGIGHHVQIITDDHTVGDAGQRLGVAVTRPVTIEDGVWIAADVTILPGVTIGRGSIVAAGAVVTGDVPPDVLVGGVPSASSAGWTSQSPRSRWSSCRARNAHHGTSHGVWSAKPTATPRVRTSAVTSRPNR